MKLKTIAAAMLFGCLCAGAVSAAGEIEKREGMMKQIGGAMGALNAIAKGQKPYDAEAVKAAVTTISTNAKAFPDQFPAGTETGSAASPAIWQNFDDFKAKSEKLGADADAVLAQLPADQAGVATAMQSLGADCGVCHQTYRLKR
ncbi:cytochrome c [Rhizobium sp. CG4]|uniref:c-type cytochrome n=1 Tax=Rhizobium/Agrobacterium group TaxID=227290 RepID=UPI00177F928E|nr:MULTISPECIES: cytochrome c [Rhizobium/Agrobacterium group]MBD9386298.1 cytochrome c [Agrobacterium sp. AGB01]MCM2455626.1 cytochrome c [Rhizobium sp. CG4]MCS4241877.1 cytochrome c556 [Rhizobium sp. BIGb0125]MDO5894799.1 cytochrome c [Agrobacterium sp. Azo12]